MSETTASAPGHSTSSRSISPANDNPGVAALARLTERIATLVPPEAAARFGRRPLSPAVEAGMARASAISQRATQRAAVRPARSPRTTVGMALDSFVAACSFVPYAVVAFGMRLLMARIFFFDGQTKVDGPRLLFDLYNFHFSFALPLYLKAETFTAFATQFAPLPVPPMLAAYLVSYAEFILPIMLVLGFGARIAAFGMLIMTAVISIYIMPEALWTVQIYWFAILMLLLSQGPGQISVDYLVRLVTRRA
jgi:putative oxidoreductase